MASLTPRMSGLWSTEYFTGQMDEEDIERQEQEQDGRTALDRTIDRIGMGHYQWTLLGLCGFGWMADNVKMWIQTIAIILPRVQQHYSVPDGQIGYVSSSMFAGMMVGAVGWGSCSDLVGRIMAFNLTLFFTALFGILAAFAPSYIWLCVILFFLGTSVGGSMPTDGTLLLEHMPQGKEYLVTALSVFFSLGAVASAIVGIVVIPPHSCPSTSTPSDPCDVAISNLGWKYLLGSVGTITLSMFLGRIVFFRLHESPRFLVSAGRPHDAIVSLQKISQFNGSELSLKLHDVDDTPQPPKLKDDEVEGPHSRTPLVTNRVLGAKRDVRIVFGVSDDMDDADEADETRPLNPSGVAQDIQQPATNVILYDSTGASDISVPHYSQEANSTAQTSRQTYPRSGPSTTHPGEDSLAAAESKALSFPTRLTRPPSHSISPQRRSSFHEAQAKMFWSLPRWLRKPLWAWLDKIALVLSPEWFKTTMLVWAMWGLMSLAYTMFNVYLPKLLEMRSQTDTIPKTLEQTMWEVVIFTLGGCPGAILGAYLVDSPLGRRWSLASSTFVTAAFCYLFVLASNSLVVRVSTIGISLSATTMWAVLYGWTPEIFDTEVRGTACGTASALSRIGGMIAPILGGALLQVSTSLPVYTSIVVFTMAGLCTVLLKGREGKRSESMSIMH